MTKPFKPRFSLHATVTLCVIFFLLGAVHGGMAGFYAGMGYVMEILCEVGE